MSQLFYNVFLGLYLSAIKVAAVGNGKAKQWVTGRQGVIKKLKEKFGPGDKIIWMHCASLGEFEQGRPLLEKLKHNFPAYKILLTFFSPSGYEVRKDYEGAHHVCYLPMDGSENAKDWYDAVNVSLVLFVKYEYWFYYLREAKKRDIPLLLVSGIFREDQPFFKWYAGFYKKMLSFFSYFLLQNQTSAVLLETLGYKKNVLVTGDTRFDRVIEIAEKFTAIEPIEQFIGKDKVVVAGSTWTEDDKELNHYANKHRHIKFIIAPHNINAERIKECKSLYKHSVLFSALKKGAVAPDCNVLIIDNIGMLSRLYKYATVTYVGGGFGADGVHNVLEPAVFGKPVLFGAEYSKFVEAIELVETGGAISVKSAVELEKVLDDLLRQEQYYNKTGKAARQYVYHNSGATQKTVEFIYAKRLLTN